MSEIQAIAIAGKKGAGKDTVANHLVKNFGFTKLAFADPLKDAIEDIFGFSHEQLYGNLKEEKDSYWNVTPRAILQFVGNECFRTSFEEYFPDIGQDLWVRAMKKRIEQLKSRGINKVVISDLRYQNELEMLKREYKTKVGLVVRKPLTAISGNSAYSTHESECSLDLLVPDVVFENNSSIESLYSQVSYFLNSL